MSLAQEFKGNVPKGTRQKILLCFYQFPALSVVLNHCVLYASGTFFLVLIWCFYSDATYVFLFIFLFFFLGQWDSLKLSHSVLSTLAGTLILKWIQCLQVVEISMCLPYIAGWVLMCSWKLSWMMAKTSNFSWHNYPASSKTLFPNMQFSSFFFLFCCGFFGFFLFVCTTLLPGLSVLKRQCMFQKRLTTCILIDLMLAVMLFLRS